MVQPIINSPIHFWSLNIGNKHIGDGLWYCIGLWSMEWHFWIRFLFRTCALLRLAGNIYIFREQVSGIASSRFLWFWHVGSLASMLAGHQILNLTILEWAVHNLPKNYTSSGGNSENINWTNSGSVLEILGLWIGGLEVTSKRDNSNSTYLACCVQAWHWND